MANPFGMKLRYQWQTRPGVQIQVDLVDTLTGETIHQAVNVTAIPNDSNDPNEALTGIAILSPAAPSRAFRNSLGQIIQPVDETKSWINGDLYEKHGQGWIKLSAPAGADGSTVMFIIAGTFILLWIVFHDPWKR